MKKSSNGFHFISDVIFTVLVVDFLKYFYNQLFST
uniref:Uncharacterized protein n=1 Tax=Lepeophtheirus salmonis TaxID=72036 RepID=A0A0K2TRJ8_LEPSM